jgi:hypothetical protein
MIKAWRLSPEWTRLYQERKNLRYLEEVYTKQIEALEQASLASLPADTGFAFSDGDKHKNGKH